MEKYDSPKGLDNDGRNHYETLGKGLAYFKSGIEHARKTLSGANERIDETVGKAFLPVYSALANDPASKSWTGRHKGDLITLVVIPAALTALAASHVYFTDTKYNDSLNKLTHETLPNTTQTIGAFFNQGKMPVQGGGYEVINLGHTSLNPFDVVGASVKLHKEGTNNTLYHFVTRDLSTAENKLIQDFNKGVFDGSIKYKLIAAADAAYYTIRSVFSLGKRISKEGEKN